MNVWLPVVLVLVVGAVVFAIHLGAMRWLARQPGPDVAAGPEREKEQT
jgi:uncharacterized iron-regulated membrane protein